MKVHFITSRPTLENDISLLRDIANFVKGEGHHLVNEWIEIAYNRMARKPVVSPDWNSIYKDNLEVITRTDVVIAETSFDSFGVGYQIAFAVQQRKPILLLRHETADDNVYVTGVRDGWIRHEKYTQENVHSIVKKFLDDNDIKSKEMRFNFFLDRKIYNYLRWASFKTGKTKAEILRDLVQQEIDKKGLLD